MDIETNGTRIHVSQLGSGELALVFLHYYGGSSRTWDKVAKALPDRYRIVATDHRGWGDSAAPAHGYRIEDLANDAEGVIEALGLKRFVLVGHSMGGKVAQLMASRRPKGLEGLVLVAPSPPSPMLLSDEERATLSRAYQSRESVEFVIDRVLTARPLDAACREQVIEDSLKAAPQAKAAWPEVAMREDISVAVASIVVPTIVVSGEQDQVDRVATLQAELLPRIPHAAMHILPGTGHLSPLEAPVEVAQNIARFVAAIEDKSVVCNSPADVPAAFDAAMNAGDLDALLRVFSNNATMRMTNGDVAQESPGDLRRSLAHLLAMRPHIRNTVRRVLSSGEIALVLLDWTLSIPRPDGQKHVEQGAAAQVLEKGRDGGWRLRISNPLGLN
ncbi:alpha/beta fold hydrolase [Paraburkholderia sabiae]|uniref:Alpha/beta fold hydrolase n=1 Tax=Paraburkholderia sabiae TaxID=273251 RepID=A0ABU9QRY6_9BURK|nr:alpha/beta fold hydrolase [Paraburkholderia sabiae]WJZ72305.1 alpha/beta fold hydrolase [Paraburkholderia sabiae]CAD6537958.1 2-succinyl-6-hydroxy-2, 4-cyclohexadiene-1-carboxylate synthase [Paraburkholderia sabiae]